MRGIILTEKQNGVSNSYAHRVGAGEVRSAGGEVHSKKSNKSCLTAEEAHSVKAEELHSDEIKKSRFHTTEASTFEALRLFTASEAARILHVSRNAIYALWRDGQLDFWRINGTMTTNLTAIRDFLERARNADLTIDRIGT